MMGEDNIIFITVAMPQLWSAYLTERRTEVRGLPVDHPRVTAMNNTYERALVTMHKMPRVWLDYLQHLMQQFLVTQTRRAFDRALCSLPITQHDRVWQLYLVNDPAPVPLPSLPTPAKRACRCLWWLHKVQVAVIIGERLCSPLRWSAGGSAH